jgi:hypothetical protein
VLVFGTRSINGWLWTLCATTIYSQQTRLSQGWKSVSVILRPSSGQIGSAGCGLVLGDDLKRKGFTVLENRAAIQAEAGDAQYRKLYSQHLSFFAIRVVARGTVDCSHGAVRKSLRVKPGGLFCCAVILPWDAMDGLRSCSFPLLQLEGPQRNHLLIAAPIGTVQLGSVELSD